jgi:nitrite reductase (cytochrome c-552)
MTRTFNRLAVALSVARVAVIQQRNHDLLRRGGKAIVELIDAIVAAKSSGGSAAALATAQRLQRRAQWRLDFIASENSMGFHAPQEAARVLAEAIDYAREGQIALLAPAVPVAEQPAQP